MNRFIFGNLLYFNRIILCILMINAVQLCKIQRDFLHICTLYVELCRYFFADVAHRKGQDLFGRAGKGKTQGAASPMPRRQLPVCGRIWNAPLRCDGRLPYYIYIEKTPRPAAWCCGRGGSGAYLLQIRPIRLGRPRASAGI